MTTPASPVRTLADYLAMAVAPAWIMGMVGSLMLFLVEAIYRGAFGAEVRWTLCWFVLAAVLVSRISIQQGTSYATLYGLTLGAATALRLSQFIGLNPLALLLIALLWWCASKLTWDCTLIDDDADASGEGLLDRAGLQPGAPDAPPTAASAPPATSAPARSKPIHTPGLWVVYFSLGALPVFGLGQLAIPLDDPSARFRGFLWLCVYLGCAMGLLFTTSFLGLRRYLRQRRLLMPAPVARLWLGLGAIATIAILVGALFLPRPEAADTLAGLAARLPPVSSPDPSRTNGRSDERSGETRPRAESNEQESEQTARFPSGPERDAVGARPADEGQPGRGRRAEDQQGGQTPTMGEAPARLLDGLRWLTIAAGMMLALAVLIRFVPQWLQKLKRRKASPRTAAAQPNAGQPRRNLSFAAYPNPFTTGRAARMSPTQLTIYTFEALQAWAADHGCARRPEQTPAEFGRTVTEFVPTLSREVLGSVRLYQRVAYAPGTPTPESMDVLERLWSGMTTA
jgi:hypothetical protein